MGLEPAARTNANTARTNANILHKDLCYRIVAAFLRVYDRLGFGFLESVYRNALAWEFTRSGIPFVREAVIDVWDEGKLVGHFRADFLVDNCVLVEGKASQQLCEADRKQLLNYLRGSSVEVGLLVHFGPKAATERFIYTNDRKNTDKHEDVTRTDTNTTLTNTKVMTDLCSFVAYSCWFVQTC
jgi:GxxExxY protein